jgi:cell division protein FtsL
VKKRGSPFLVLWTLAVAAATSAFVVHLATRVKTIELGYELGAAHARLARLREVKRVLELERASLETPERVDFVARTLFGMAEPDPERLLPGGPMPTVADELAVTDNPGPTEPAPEPEQ